MGVRKKIFLIILVTVLTLSVILYSVLNTFLSASYAEMEEQDIFFKIDLKVNQ